MSSLLTGFVGEKRVPSAPYKHLPVHPLISPAVDFSFRNICRVRPSCANCFPQTSEDLYHNYVDLFDFSKVSYEEVAAVMKTEEAKSPNISKQAIKKKVVAFYYEIRATLSRFICKICGYLLFKVFRRLMTRLLISPLQMKRIVEAEKTGIPLVYLPLHRSHLDYLLITWTAWHFGLRLPHIASGDNLNLSGLGWLLRSTGAFFIRRRTDEHDEGGKDACYRCRFGKSQLPKHGLISNVVKAVQERTISDCYLVPVSYTYDSVAEGTISDCYLVPVSYTYDSVAEGVFLDELMGIPKCFAGVLRSFGKSRRCGAVRMHFGNPVLLTDYMNALHEALSSRNVMPQLSRIPHTVSYRELVPWHAGHKEKPDDRSLIRAIGYHIVHEAQSIISISLVSVICSLLLCKFRQVGFFHMVIYEFVHYLPNF
ncbi:Acyltransferase [Cooperia oncophora]